MSDNKLGVAIVHEVCPICGKPMNESIVINKRLTVKEAKKVEDMNHKAIDLRYYGITGKPHPNAKFITGMIREQLIGLGYDI